MNDKKKYPKVLVISHNVFSNTSNMGKTLGTFFSNWPKESLAQLYIHSEVPTTDICINYFRITDFEVLKSIIKRNKPGEKLGKKDIRCNILSEKTATGIKKTIYIHGKKRKPYMYIGRNAIWALNTWKTKKLYDWINEFKPDVIFFATSDYTLLYKLALHISEKYNIPIIPYVCDDYYYAKRSSISPLYWINRFTLRSTIKKLFASSSNFIAICEKLGEEYTKEFKTQSTVLMTGSSINYKTVVKKTNEISYIGNLGLNRWKTLIEIGRSIKELSETNNPHYLHIYSSETRTEIIKHLTEQNGIKFHGSIDAQKVHEVMQSSKILLHVESMDKINRDKVKYSVSTKIADSLASGTCLLAYGPEEVASIEYLSKNQAACIITESNELKSKLAEIIQSEKLRQMYINNAILLSERFHNKENNSMLLEKLIKNTVNKME